MKKKTNKQTSKVLFYLAIGSCVITLLEGLLYYSAEVQPNPLFRWMMIVQNTINAFAFKSNISVSDVAEIIQESENMIEIVVGYFYSIAMFVAPYCTVAYIYKVIERLLRIKYWNGWRYKDKDKCIIFGYNDAVKALLNNADINNYRIHLVDENVSEDEELSLLKKGILVHKVNLLNVSNDEAYFLNQMEIKDVRVVILFEDSSAKNFSLYQMFHNSTVSKIPMRADIKFYCRCEDAGIQSILEDYHDKTVTNDSDKKLVERKDIEIVSIPELRVRKLLSKNRLHNYYLNDLYNHEEKLSFEKTKDWHLHMLIVGFGKIGQQLLLQSMNQGIISGNNKIIFDVVDFNIDEKKSVFANNFNDEYVTISENEISIPSGKADGELRIRFHKMDIRFHEFQKILREYGNEKKGEIFTFIAICLKNTDISLHCLTQVQQYLRRCDTGERVSVAIRMEYDKQMAEYLNEENSTYKNVFAIEDTESTITLADLLHDDIDNNAKEFNRIYEETSLCSKSDYKEDSDKTGQSTNDVWKKLPLVLRNSNRALAYHQEIKIRFLEEKDDKGEVKETMDLSAYLGTEGTVLQDRENAWTYDSEIEVAQKQSDMEKYPLIAEFSKMEHRRWCYYMASCGWKRTDNPQGAKNPKLKENPCLCNWDELVKNKPSACPYDLMPLILYYQNQKKNKKLEAK